MGVGAGAGFGLAGVLNHWRSDGLIRKFLVVVDDTPEMNAAMGYAAQRARSTGGRVVLLRVTPAATDEHWSGVRDEIRRQNREEAEALLARLSDKVVERSGHAPVFIIAEGDPLAAIRRAAAEDPDIKILVLAAASGSRGPGPIVSAILKQGVGVEGRKLPVTIVPAEMTDADIEDLA
ncbi:universal stress protein [Brevundimonas terrae]|jgi:hypothetical protein|uniref:Universal stress protein n=1 Tax=Brevundimonas terrae TaxID=363631 RepID=A0ABP3HUT7_9CAUL